MITILVQLHVNYAKERQELTSFSDQKFQRPLKAFHDYQEKLIKKIKSKIIKFTSIYSRGKRL